jgi:hypothetical protein
MKGHVCLSWLPAADLMHPRAPPDSCATTAAATAATATTAAATAATATASATTTTTLPPAAPAAGSPHDTPSHHARQAPPGAALRQSARRS